MNVLKIAEKQLLAAEGDRQKALPLVVEALKGEPKERKRIIDKALESASWDALGRVARSLRKQYFKTPIQPQEPEGQLEEFQRIAYHNWYSCPLPNGMLLGNATKDDLIAARGMWTQQADSNRQRSEWAGRLAERLTGKKTVRASLTEEQLEALAGEVSLAILVA